MKSVFYLLDTAPYGSEKAFGALNAAAVSLGEMDVTLGLYGDGVYLAVAGQDSRKLGLPNLADILYAYGELKVLVNEPSLIERCLFGETLIETLELADEEEFFEAMESSDCVISF
ncbi:DsrE family protein [Methanosarcina sp. UBA5]|uniref:DsrE family protein n=1 Tax=Methanosarcina sp. UBA5 TaxID=1915593 RepID=UPI0025D1BA9F|nr:DsrE family protein [Methanosarcina sp. UBA5]